MSTGIFICVDGGTSGLGIVAVDAKSMLLAAASDPVPYGTYTD